MARVRLKNGQFQAIAIEADDYSNAKAMIEQTYGNGSIISGPILEEGFAPSLLRRPWCGIA
jgi:hypothetical protein